MTEWFEALQATPGYNLQDALWSIATPPFWLATSVVSLLGALALFVSLMREVDRRRSAGLHGIDSLMVGRMGWMAALVLGAGVRFNSGMLIASFALFVLSGTFMSLLIATRWCERRGSFFYKCGQIVGEVAAYVRRPETTIVKPR